MSFELERSVILFLRSSELPGKTFRYTRRYRDIRKHEWVYIFWPNLDTGKYVGGVVVCRTREIKFTRVNLFTYTHAHTETSAIRGKKWYTYIHIARRRHKAELAGRSFVCFHWSRSCASTCRKFCSRERKDIVCLKIGLTVGTNLHTLRYKNVKE